MQKSVYEFISKTNNPAKDGAGDPIVEWKTCAISGKEFAVFQSDLVFYDKISPTFAGKKFPIPAPTLCPEERQRRRLAWRNERKLYRRNCDASNKQIISVYSPDKPYKVYEQPIWRSDSRDPLSYGKAFDFSRTFTQQMNELIFNVLHPALCNEYNTLVNSEYNNQTGNLKNCYMLSNSDYDEICLYGKWVNRCDKVIDAFKTYDSNNSYSAINCYNVSFCFYIYNCKDCFQCYNCCNLIQCKFCIDSSNLVGQEYCINNTHYSKEEYEKLAPQYRNNQLIIQWIQKNMDLIQTENCSGNFISQCRNSHLCYDVEGMDASKYCCDLKKGQSDSVLNYDVSYFGA